jgi:hypothetical protein
MNLSCRICLEEDERINLISPCNCDGTTKFIHRQCLNTWRLGNIENDNFKRCEICHFEYEIEKKEYSKCEKIFKQILKIYSKNFILLFLTIQLLILALFYLFTAIDSHGKIADFIEFKNYYDDYYILSVFTVVGTLSILIFIHDLKFYCDYKDSENGTEFYFEKYASVGLSKLIYYIFINILFYFFSIAIGSVISIFIFHFIISHMFDKRYKINLINERVKDQCLDIELEEINI